MTDNSEAVPYTWITYAERLGKAGVSWRNYQQPDTGLPSFLRAAAWS